MAQAERLGQVWRSAPHTRASTNGAGRFPRLPATVRSTGRPLARLGGLQLRGMPIELRRDLAKSRLPALLSVLEEKQPTYRLLSPVRAPRLTAGRPKCNDRH